MNCKPLFKKAGKYLWAQWIKPFALAAAIVFPLKSAVADWNWVPTGSMKPTILEGDLVFVNKLAYDFKVPFTLWRMAEWDNPNRGDVVVFFAPTNGIRMVKRVIGLPGDTVELRNNILLINGVPATYEIQQPHNFASEIYEDPMAIVALEKQHDLSHLVMALPSRQAARTFGPIIIPEGKYFLMGDSRDNSYDSRFYGAVERKRIVGKSGPILLSLNKNNKYIPRLSRFLAPLQ